MIAELGHYALMLALGLALIQATMPIVGTRSDDPTLISVAAPAALAQFVFVALSFGALAICYVTSDFSVLNVYENSNSAMPLLYRFTSVWGNHEGSMMLWVSILALFGALVAALGSNLPAKLKANALAVQAWIAAAFELFILTTSNPFLRIADAPFEGRDLNPILQDPGLAFHPPLLYLGYVGFSISFSFAIAALLEGRIDAAWARWVRPWVLVAWMCLTLGIAGGSYWAYYELGWGGYWFWDPVENASLMPWLAGTALLHSAVVMEKRGALKVWTILLAILAFSLSLIGTFLVRSGALTSVHAFATDPRRGIFILAILVAFIGGALALYAWRAPLLKQGGLFAPISREGALVLNNLFLTCACATVFVGTLYPLALEALTSEKISVGPPFFNATFGPLFVPLLLMMPFGPLLGWKRGDLLGAAQRLLAAAFVAAVAIAATFAVQHGGPVLAPFGVGLALFVMAGALIDLAERTMILRIPLGSALRRAAGLPGSAWGTAFAHFGIGVTLLGIVVVRQLLSSGFRPVLRPEAEMLLRLRSPNDNAAKLRTKLREAGLRPTRTRVALSELLFSQGDRHVTAERLFEEANQARVSVSLATVYNTLHQFTEVGFLREVAIDASKSYFDTNATEHHHFYIEDRHELMDIPPTNVIIGKAPVPPDGYEIARIDVVVRLRRKVDSQLRPCL